MIKAIQGNILRIISQLQNKAIAIMGWVVFAMTMSHPSQAHDDPHSVFLEDYSTTEIAQSLKDKDMGIIIPVGGVEQSGPYIVVGKHNKRVGTLAQEIARHEGHMLVAPTLSYVPEGLLSPRTSHMRFAGTVSVRNVLFEGLLTDIAQSFQVQGFHWIIFIGDHGGYQTQLRHVADKLNMRWQGTHARVLYIGAYYESAYRDFVAWLTAHGYKVGVRQHADIVDTSLSLGSDPKTVREDALRVARYFSPAQGIYGASPKGASADIGRIGIRMQVLAACREIEKEKEEQNK